MKIKLYTYMRERGLNITKMAEMFGVNRSYLNRIMMGKTKPSKRLAFMVEKMTDGYITEKELLE